MKWFKKLFRGKLEKQTEETATRKHNNWRSFRNDSFLDPKSGCSSQNVKVPREVYALTTMKNFRDETYEEFVSESSWVILEEDDFEGPEFQHVLRHPDTLTTVCNSMSQRSFDVRREEIVVTPPNCLCPAKEKIPQYVKRNVFQRCARAIAGMWKCFCKKVKKCCLKKKTPDEALSEIRRYIAAGRVRALRGGRQTRGVGAALRAYAFHLAQDKSTTFAQNIDNFIACTLDSKETCPQVMMRNMRQFMSGMKNYLVKHGEREFEKEVEKERLKLKSTEFLNLDAILEGVMHRLVVRPLRAKLYMLLATWHSSDVRRMHAAIDKAHHITPLQLGVKESTRVPSAAVLTVISKHFLKMQEADSPLDKLENLLAAISVVFNVMRGECKGADDLLPVLAWSVARCRLVCVELEAELMTGLLPAALQAGEGGYYLTVLYSAVEMLKKLVPENGPDGAISQWRRGSMESRSECSVAVVRVVLPDECRGSIRRVPVPCRPGARARDLCRALAHAAAITNPQDYGLFILHDGHETMLNENDCPQDVMIEKPGRNFTLAYRRIDAKIAWPQQALMSYP